MKKIGWFILIAIFFPTLLLAQGIEFRTCSFEEALAAAKQEKKMVFIDFYASWCGPCKQMAKEVFTLKEVGDFFYEKFVNLKIDGQKGEGPDLIRKYRVSGYPTFIVLNADGEEIMRIAGAKTKEQFVGLIRKGTDPAWSPDGLRKRYEGGERTPVLVNSYAWSLIEKGKGEQGDKVIQDYFDQLSDIERTEPVNFFLFSRYAVSYKDPKADYLFDNKNAFIQKNGKEHVEELLNKWLLQEMLSYVTVKDFPLSKEKAKDLKKAKQKMKKASMCDAPSMVSLVKLAEVCRAGNIQKYIATCREVFPQIDAQTRFYILLDLSYLANQDDKVKGEAVKLIEEHLEQVEPINRRMLSRVISKLTKK